MLKSKVSRQLYLTNLIPIRNTSVSTFFFIPQKETLWMRLLKNRIVDDSLWTLRYDSRRQR
jgi:hypothetical protein